MAARGTTGVFVSKVLTMSDTAIAIDLGSSSGRIVVGVLDDGTVSYTEVHRFPNRAEMRDGYLCWDLETIWQGIVTGLRTAIARFPAASTVSIDTWGVDWVPLDHDDQIVTPGRCYRDERSVRTQAEFRERLPDDRSFELTGIAPATINSANQLFAYRMEEPEAAARTSSILFLPDYFTWRLTGRKCWSRSIASTSALCTPGGYDWAESVFHTLEIPRSWVGEVSPELDEVGPVVVDGLEQLTVVRAGAHDSACAVGALEREAAGDSYFLSCGSWSVLGVLRDQPLLGQQARHLGLTNEACADARVRPLFNITGLWMLQECQRRWAEAGDRRHISELIAGATERESVGVIFDPDEPQFAQPGDMVGRIVEALRLGGVTRTLTADDIVRVICESLAARYARGVADLAVLTGSRPTQFTITGGGSRNELLCDLSAQAIGVPVISGPAEASTLGSLVGQFLITAAITESQRTSIIRASAHTRTHQP